MRQEKRMHCIQWGRRGGFEGPIDELEIRGECRNDPEHLLVISTPSMSPEDIFFHPIFDIPATLHLWRTLPCPLYAGGQGGYLANAMRTCTHHKEGIVVCVGGAQGFFRSSAPHSRVVCWRGGLGSEV